MHIYIFSDGELIAILAFTAILAWVSATFWTKRRIRQGAFGSVGTQSSALEPLQQENRDLRALVERQEERIRALETIATDPSERTARAIDALR